MCVTECRVQSGALKLGLAGVGQGYIKRLVALVLPTRAALLVCFLLPIQETHPVLGASTGAICKLDSARRLESGQNYAVAHP
jgi:hypothetical protein